MKVDLAELKRQVVGHAEWLAISLAGLDASDLTGKHVTCPFHGGEGDFRFHNRRGLGDWICTCGHGDIFDLIRLSRKQSSLTGAIQLVDEALNGSMPTAVVYEPAAPKTQSSSKDTGLKAKKLWRESLPITEEDPAGKYLNQTRSLQLKSFPYSLRYHPSLATIVEGEFATFPALIAAYCNPEGRLSQIHRTFLTADGQKADLEKPKKMMAGSVPKGGAIRLAPVTDTIGIAEGIETALSAQALYGLPVWAAYSKGYLESFEPPSLVHTLIVFADNDKAGMDAANGLARRLVARGIDVQIRVPKEGGTDFNDLLVSLRK